MEQGEYLRHAEDSLRVRPGSIRGGRLWWERGQIFTMAHRGRGAGVLRAPSHQRQQQVIVKPKVVNVAVQGGRNWFAHGAYLQRRGIQGKGFDREQEGISVSQTLGSWQRDGDPYYFSITLSPEHSAELDLPAFVRSFMDQVDRDVGTQTQWGAIAHHNTDHPHVHLSIKGEDKSGQAVRIDEGYLWGGLRQRASEVATRMLGWRTGREIEQGLEQAVARQRWSQLDRMLAARMHGRRVHVDGTMSAQERQRLEELGRRGIARAVGRDEWEMSMRWESELQDRGKPQERTHEEDRRQRLVRIIDDLEQERGR
jgi:hypothetical protein